MIRQAHSANWWLPAAAGWRLRYLHGGWSAETQLAQASLTPGKVVLESRRGTTSHQLNPWFTLDPEGTATEEDGEVWSGALAWSGSWKLVFETNPGGRVHACGGVNDFDWAYRLGARRANWSCRGSPGCTQPAGSARPAASGTPGSWPTSSGAATTARA